MKRLRRPALAVAGLLALGGLAIGFTAGEPGAFDGAPPAPLAFVSEAWDIQAHSRNQDTWFELEGMTAQHGAACEGPPATHALSGEYETAVFQCKDHLMTAISAQSNGYAVIYLTPDRMVDFSGGEASIRWDVSTAIGSDRDWWDVWITPYADNLALPLDEWLPDLQGEPRNAVHLRLRSGDDYICPEIFTNGALSFDAKTDGGCNQADVSALVPASASVRTTFEARLTRTHLSVCLPNNGFCWFDGPIPALAWSQGVVQWGHHSYTPWKGSNATGGEGTPNTWHWDNLSVSPALPFTMIKADRRFTEGGPVNFAAPAPSGARLRFAAVGLVDINDGSGWRRVAPMVATRAPEHFNSYFVAVPEGTTSVLFRFAADDWYDGPFMAKDLSIWSLGGGTPAPTNTPVPPTATATPTNTPVPPTATPTPTPKKQCNLRWGGTTVEQYGALTEAECQARGE